MGPPFLVEERAAVLGQCLAEAVDAAERRPQVGVERLA